jgi:hypothetical protein
MIGGSNLDFAFTMSEVEVATDRTQHGSGGCRGGRP